MSVRRRIGAAIPALAHRTQTRSTNLLAAFDADWYRAEYPDAREAEDPLGHYLSIGWARGYDPCPLFDTSWYVERNQDVLAVGINPLVHYVDYGWAEGRDPCPLFSTAWYLNQFPGRATWSPDPMTHYRLEGWRLGIDPHPLFDVDFYLLQLGQEASLDLIGDPLSHYMGKGWRLDLEPNAIFASAWYREHHADNTETRMDPLTHYVTTGAARGYDPSPLFSTTGYATKYPHCGGRAEALAHYLEFGRGEGLTVVHSEATVAPGHAVTDVRVTGQVPAPSEAPRIAIVAGHDVRGITGLATQHLCRALQEAGITVILTYDHLVENADAPDAPWTAVVAAQHTGYDFFSWRLALEQLPSDENYEEILLLNDSIVGPFAPLDELLNAWRAAPFAVTGLVESNDPRPHLQSWGVRFSGHAANRATLLAYYGRATERLRKGDLIDFLEIPLTEHFRTRGYSTGSIFSQTSVASATRNPAIYGWRELLASGLPFVKREVLSLPEAVVATRRIDVVDAITQSNPQGSRNAIGELLDDALAQINRPPITQ